MNSPRRQELDTLQSIETQVKQVEDRVDARLPSQRLHLLAFIAAWRWRLQTLRRRAVQQDEIDSISKKLRLETGTFDYQVKEQSELLTRYLCQLDNVLSYGDPAIKEARKALVLHIQTLLQRADALKRTAAKLKAFTESVIAHFPRATTSDDEELEQQNIAPLFDESADDIDMETQDMAEDGADAEDADDTDGMEQDGEQKQDVAEPEEEDEDEENDEDDGEDEDEEDASEEQQSPERASCGSRIAMPVWRPYYQIQKRSDGVYLLANLRGVDPRHLRVQCSPDEGLLRVSGVKLPTQKDLVLSRWNGVPTFGRFEIAERFPTNLLHLENATQQLRPDGTLEIRLPYYFVHHPRVFRRVSPFQPHSLVVW
ncbi:hypothetical protein P43SY_006558 [Pythium insidiosum]|uniref:BAG domain-containing protein n=1 Tax=Pythium insidiosum TaxID=114742 RepID=A0AAD5LAV8_PYTIN|nr:hypothetical protein P43SY_006558 [Pythium insidiosum]